MREESFGLVRVGTFVTAGFLALGLVCAVSAVGTVSAQQVEISEPGELNETSAEGNYVLVNDINASGVDFEPVGDEDERFTGRFDGDGYVISGLTVNSTESKHVGFFGYVGSDGTVTNVGLEGVKITGGDSTGGLVGRNEGDVLRSHVSGSVEGGDNVGGLVGRNVGTITESYASANVVGTDRVGGLVGRSVDSVSESYATGSVEGVSSVGGAVGSNVGVISDTYSTSNIEGEREIGGLVGTDVGGTIERTYAGGEMSPGRAAGGVVGAGNSNTEVTDSYWNRDTLSEGRVEGTALTNSQITGTEAVGNMDLDFDDVWEHRDDGYPVLAWQVHGYESTLDDPNMGTTDENNEEEQNTSDGGDDEYQPPDEGLPGFGAIVAVISLLVGGVLVRRGR
jgi:PGF-CTERM protein